MNSEQQAAIERLRELEKTAICANWEKLESEMGLCEIKAGRNIIAKNVHDDDAALIVALRNEAIPLLIALAAENKRLRSERDEINAELNEELDGKFNFIADCESAIEKIGKERDALQARIDGALRVLEIPSWHSMVKEAIEILKGEQGCE